MTTAKQHWLHNVLICAAFSGSCLAIASGLKPVSAKMRVNELIEHAIRSSLGSPVALRFSFSNSYRDFHLKCGNLTAPDGSDFNYSSSSLRSEWEAGYVDNQFCALIDTSANEPAILELSVGSTDAPQVEWTERYSLPLDILTQDRDK